MSDLALRRSQMILRKLAGKVSKSFSNSGELDLRPCRFLRVSFSRFPAPQAGLLKCDVL